MVHIVEINEDNIVHLKKFLINVLPSTFRYFNTRNIDVIKNHIITIILLDNEIPIGYAHIDYEHKYWFGICVLEEYHGMGYGNLLMDYIFNNEKIKSLNEIHLCVDKININAINLYKKFNFQIIDENEYLYVMKKLIS